VLLVPVTMGPFLQPRLQETRYLRSSFILKNRMILAFNSIVTF